MCDKFEKVQYVNMADKVFKKLTSIKIVNMFEKFCPI